MRAVCTVVAVDVVTVVFVGTVLRYGVSVRRHWKMMRVTAIDLGTATAAAQQCQSGYSSYSNTMP